MAKFKIGDKIKATADSDSEYLVTCKKRGWTGIVVGIGDYGALKLKTITPSGIVHLHFFNFERDETCRSYSTDMIEKV